MIYTVTLNPALDYTIQVQNMTLGHINRTAQEHLFAGGKGINVSSILKQLNTESTALGFIADFTGIQLKDMLEAQGIKTDLIQVKQGMTRINVKIKSSTETEINGKGPLIQNEDFELLLNKLSHLNQEDVLVLSGSIPSCMPADTYERILEQVHHCNACVFVDAEKKLLMNTLKYHPFFIKPNKNELEQMFDVTLKSDEDILIYAKKLQEMGAKNVLVSMAGDGALLVCEDGTSIRMNAAHGTLVNSVGAGDSMVAGFLAGWLKTRSYEKALLLGSACGSATAFSAGLADKEMIEHILMQLSENTGIDAGGLIE